MWKIKKVVAEVTLLKEEKKMKKFVLPVLVFGMLVSFAGIAQADLSKDVPVTAFMASTETLTVTVKPFGVGVSTWVNFGDLLGETTWYAAPDEYIEIGYKSNEFAWRIEVYTNNFPSTDPSTSTWGFSYGGLIESTGTPKRMPMAWAVRDASVVLNSTPPPGVVGSSWTFLMDKADKSTYTYTAENDYEVTKNVKGDAYLGAGGYPTFIFGSPSYSNIARGDYEEDPGPQNQAATTPVAMMLNSCPPVTPAGNYSSKLWFDLIHD